MTDKIIIDGVDVSGCNYAILPKKQCPMKSMPYAKETSCIACKEHNTKLNFCKNNPNCYYKNLQKAKSELAYRYKDMKTNNFRFLGEDLDFWLNLKKEYEKKNISKLSNYERIKNMTVDEMAEVFNRKFCEECGYKENDFVNWEDCDANCWANIKNGYYKKWLLEEATESEKK